MEATHSGEHRETNAEARVPQPDWVSWWSGAACVVHVALFDRMGKACF